MPSLSLSLAGRSLHATPRSTGAWPVRLALGMLALLPFLAACGASAPRAGGDAAANAARLERELQQAPGDPVRLEAYGLALAELDRDSEAMEAFEAAFDRDPGRIGAALALGRAAVEREEHDRAEEIYRRARPASGEQRELIRAAEAGVARARLAVEMRHRLAEERAIEPASLPEQSLAVVEFAPAPGVPAAYTAFGKALGAVVTTELSQVTDLRLVERRRLAALLAEIERHEAGRRGAAGAESDASPAGPAEGRSRIDGAALAEVTTALGVQQRLAELRPAAEGPPYYTGRLDGISGPGTRAAIEAFQREQGLTADGVAGERTQRALEELFQGYRASLVETERGADPMGAPALAQAAERHGPRAGRILGARRLLGGIFEAPPEGVEGAVTVHARLVDTVDGAGVAEFTTQQPLERFGQVAGEVVLRTCEALRLPLTPEQLRRLASLPPATRSMAAFLAFGRGIDFEERGLYDEAAAAYAEALRLDARFALARERAAVVPLGTQGLTQAMTRTIQTATRALRGASRATIDRTLGAVGTGIAAETPRNDSGDPGRSVQADGPPTGSIRVIGQIPVGGK